MEQAGGPEASLNDEQLAQWLELLESRTGICLASHPVILRQSLLQHFRSLGIEDSDDYLARVRSSSEGAVEWSWLAGVIAIKETRFFRDSAAFALVQQFVRRHAPRSRELDLWSVGCATGEEAYSLAVAAMESVELVQASSYVSVTGLDISPEALDVARAGFYARRKFEGVPPGWVDKYFSPEEGGFRVLPRVRSRVAFVRGNLLELEHAPILAMDVIFCQNVLVYFRRERQAQVLNALVDRLKPGGILVIGPSEGAGWQNPLVRRVAASDVHAYERVHQ